MLFGQNGMLENAWKRRFDLLDVPEKMRWYARAAEYEEYERSDRNRKPTE